MHPSRMNNSGYKALSRVSNHENPMADSTVTLSSAATGSSYSRPLTGWKI